MALTQPRIHLSGGAANAASIFSLGGKASLAVDSGVGSQKVVWTTTSMTGVVLCEGQGMFLGDGTLSYDPGTGWMSFAFTGKPTIGVQLGSDGLYPVGGIDRYFIVSITTSLLPIAPSSFGVTVLPFKNAVFDDVLNTDRSSGRTEYRCLYLKNEDSSNILNPIISVANPTLGMMKIAKEYVYSGVSALMRADGALSNMAWGMLRPFYFRTEFYKESLPNHLQTFKLPFVVNEDDGPIDQDSDGSGRDVSPLAVDEADSTHVTARLAFTTSLSWAKITPGHYVSFWLQRTIPSGTTGLLINDVSGLTLSYTP